VLKPQLPPKGEVYLDHIAHFVPDIAAGAQAFERLGYVVTPYTPQFNADPETGELVAAGTANRCLMFRNGYVEMLTAVSDTPLSAQMKRQVGRYTGVHLIAFAAGDIGAAADALDAEGFQPAAPVRLRRQVETAEGGSGELRFSVVRVPPDKMPEGRIQILAHHTPELMWQRRWLDHPNGIEALLSVLLVVADPEEAARRFGRFIGRRSQRRNADLWRLDADRGSLAFVAGEALSSVLPGSEAPTIPFMAAYALESRDVAGSSSYFSGPAKVDRIGPGCALVRLPAELGGVQAICGRGAAPPWQ
jgi:Glyoxalase-like domain